MARKKNWEPLPGWWYRDCALRLRAHSLLCLALVCATFALARPAVAGPAGDGVPGPVDSLGLSYVDRAEVEAAGAVGTRVDLTYANRPVRVFLDSQRKLAIDHRMTLRLWLDVGLFRNRLMLALSAGGSFQHYTPIGETIVQTAGRINGYDIGSEDIRLMLKGLAVDHKIVGLAITAGIIAGTGDKRSLRSEHQWGAELRVLLDAHWQYFAVVAGLGFRLHAPYNIINYLPAEDEVRVQAGSELLWSAALVTTPHRFVLFAIEAAGSETMAPRILTEARTAQLMATLRLRPRPSVEIGLSAGSSLAFESQRPEWARALLSVVWHPQAERKVVVSDKDTDHDGVPDSQDACPDKPEDRDGFEDQDGCPDPDNDGDGIPDAQDKCPNVAEDRDGYQDQDGCPDPDNDGDGVPDVQDRCPNEPEPRDAYFDGDGCPNNDADGDGIPNEKDACPNAAETKNGYQDEDGCPDVAPDPSSGVTTSPSDMPRTGQVGFALRSAVVDNESAKDLVKIVDFLKLRPRATVELEGRADRREPGKLAGERAKNVRSFLIGLGISGERVLIPSRARKGAASESSVDWRILEK